VDDANGDAIVLEDDNVRLDCSINAVSEVGDADFESDVEDDKTV
jgi:hypothetical protein